MVTVNEKGHIRTLNKIKNTAFKRAGIYDKELFRHLWIVHSSKNIAKKTYKKITKFCDFHWLSSINVNFLTKLTLKALFLR